MSSRTSAPRRKSGRVKAKQKEANVYQELRKSLLNAGEISSTEVSSYRAVCGGAWRPRNEAFWRVQYTPWDQPDSPWYVATVYPLENSSSSGSGTSTSTSTSDSRKSRGRASRLPPREIFESLLMLAELQYFLWKVREKYGAALHEPQSDESFVCTDRRKEEIDVTVLIPELDVSGWAGQLLRRLQSMEDGGHTTRLGCWRVDPEDAYAEDIRQWRQELILTPTEAVTVTCHGPQSQQQQRSINESEQTNLAKLPAVPVQSGRKRKLSKTVVEPVSIRETIPVPVREAGKRDGPVVSESDHTDDDRSEPGHPLSPGAMIDESQSEQTASTQSQHQRPGESGRVTRQTRQRLAAVVEPLTGLDTASLQDQSKGREHHYTVLLPQADDNHSLDHDDIHAHVKLKKDSSDFDLDQTEVVVRSVKRGVCGKRQKAIRPQTKRRKTLYNPASTQSTKNTRSEDNEQGSTSDTETDEEELRLSRTDNTQPLVSVRPLRATRRSHASMHGADIEDGEPAGMNAKRPNGRRQAVVKDGAKHVVIAGMAGSNPAIARADAEEKEASEQRPRRSSRSCHVNGAKADVQTTNDSKPRRRSSRTRTPSFRISPSLDSRSQTELELDDADQGSSVRARRSRRISVKVGPQLGRLYLVRIVAKGFCSEGRLEAFVANDGLPERPGQPLNEPPQPASRKYALRDRVARSYAEDVSETALEDSEQDPGNSIAAVVNQPAFVLSTSNRLSIVKLLAEYDEISCKRHGSFYPLASHKNAESARSAVDALLDEWEAMDEKPLYKELDDKENLEEQQLNNRIARILAGRRNHEIHTRYKEKEQAEHLANVVRQQQWIRKKKAPTVEETEWEQIVDRPIQFEATRTMRRARICGKDMCPCLSSSTGDNVSNGDAPECRLCGDASHEETAPDRSMFPAFFTIDADAPEFLQRDEDPSCVDDQKKSEAQEKKATRASKRMQVDYTRRRETRNKLNELKVLIDFIENYNKGLLEKQVTGP